LRSMLAIVFTGAEQTTKSHGCWFSNINHYFLILFWLTCFWNVLHNVMQMIFIEKYLFIGIGYFANTK